MDKSMIDSKEGEGTIHDLFDYSIAKEIIKDHPRVISVYTKLLPVLYAYAQYQGVWPVIQMVEDSKLLMEMQLDYYKRIYTSKGLVTDVTKKEE